MELYLYLIFFICGLVLAYSTFRCVVFSVESIKEWQKKRREGLMVKIQDEVYDDEGDFSNLVSA